MGRRDVRRMMRRVKTASGNEKYGRAIVLRPVQYYYSYYYHFYQYC